MLHDLYYTLKPILPRRLQIEARRKYADWQMSRNGSHWPIDPEAGETAEAGRAGPTASALRWYSPTTWGAP